MRGLDLSPRERDVIALVAEGLTNREIAARLGVSRFTVVGLMQRIFGKLGAANRAHAAALFVASEAAR